MEVFATTSGATRRAAGCIVAGVYERGILGVAAREIDEAAAGRISSLAKQGDISGRLGKCLMLPDVAGVRGQRVLIVGLGAKGKFGITQYRRAVAACVSHVSDGKVRDLVSYLSLESVPGSGPYYLARYAVETARNTLYRFSQLKSGRHPAPKLKKIGVAVANRGDMTRASLGTEHANAIADGMALTMDLGNLPPNICTPSYLARTAQDLARKHAKLQTRVINEAEMKRLGMNSLLSVTGGTTEPAKLIVMQYKGAARQKPIVLVGKGITFDAGGISLKPGPGMDEMKYDMCGAASVIGTMLAIAKLKLPINVNVVVPTCENLPSGTATRPGDIVTSMSGQTIEILNTDAEGRLILCDALTYAQRFKPAALIDVATLTGACVIALGHHRTGILSNSDELADTIASAGIAADDRGWRLPLADEYDQQLKSNFADMANVGGRDAGTITAGCFLQRFIDDVEWAHLDIAGTAWRSGAKKGGTGRPVPMLTQLVLQRAGSLPS